MNKSPNFAETKQTEAKLRSALKLAFDEWSIPYVHSDTITEMLAKLARERDNAVLSHKSSMYEILAVMIESRYT